MYLFNGRIKKFLILKCLQIFVFMKPSLYIIKGVRINALENTAFVGNMLLFLNKNY